MERSTKLAIFTLVLIAFVNTVTFIYITRTHEEIKISNEHLRNIHGALERDKTELTNERDCLKASPQPDPTDPICKPTPKLHLTIPTPEAHH